MDDLIAKKVDVILLAPISYEGNDESVAKAKAAGVPVINVINDQRSDDLLTKVDVSFWQLGNAAAKWAIADAQKRGMKELNAVMLPGRPVPDGSLEKWKEQKQPLRRPRYRSIFFPPSMVTAAKMSSLSWLRISLLPLARKLIIYFGCSVCSWSAALPMREAGLADDVKIIGYDIQSDTVEGVNNGLIAAAANCLGAAVSTESQ